MEFLNKIPPIIYLFGSLTLITISIVILFLGKIAFAISFLIMGISSLVAWTFFGLFEEN